MTDFKIEKGDIILAEPFMENPHFKDAVILITEHSKENGTVGFIINKTLKLSMNEVVEDFPEIELELLYGGPVQTDNLHYVHTYGDVLKDSLQVMKNLYWGGDFAQLKAL
ncbi:MAG TPA: YqgE/AlgH family protein, partial [Saprospiraceae bacterium]|nr:YqgE/AlgH family protein [Saprospiraceae bacterium]